MSDKNYSMEYERPPLPAAWQSDAERRFYIKLMDVLDDIYMRYGRLDEKMLSPALREFIAERADGKAVAQMRLDVDGLTVRVQNDEDSYSEWKASAEEILAHVGDPASEVEAGSTVRINKDEVAISTPLFSVDTHSEDGFVRVSQSGVETGHLSAPNAAERYDGAAAITVNAAVESDGDSKFRTLTDALAAVSGKWLDYDVTISFASDTSENVMALTGVYGRGSVTINGADHTANGRMVISNCASVFINGLNISCSGAVPIVQALRVQSLVLSGCSIVGDTSGVDGAIALEVFNTSARATNCGVYGVYMGLAARVGGNIYVQNCSGNCGSYALAATADGKIGINDSGTIPSAGQPPYTQDGGQIIGTGASQGGTTPVTPTTTTTEKFAPVTSRTNNTSSGWLRNTSAMQSGLLGSGNRHRGAMWFNLPSSLSGRTVQSASITLTRLKRFPDGTYVDGSSGAVTLYAETATISAQTPGGFNNEANQSEIGRWTPGATVTAALPPAAVQALIDGTANALVIYSMDTALVSGKSYSANYGAFGGSDAGQNAPVLTVTYS